MAHCTTTLKRIVSLYDQERQLLDRDEYDWQSSAAARQQFADIRADLEQYWRDRRAELVFLESGPPRRIGGGEPRDQKRQIAYGIAPLPGGGT